MDNFDKWVAALRSGVYTQGQLRLCTKSIVGNDDYFCCLGVAAELYIKETQELKRVLDEEGYYEYFDEDGNHLAPTVLPVVVRQWLNVLSDNPSTDGQSCINMNDSKVKSFSEIADWLEANKAKLTKESRDNG